MQNQLYKGILKQEYRIRNERRLIYTTRLSNKTRTLSRQREGQPTPGYAMKRGTGTANAVCETHCVFNVKSVRSNRLVSCLRQQLRLMAP